MPTVTKPITAEEFMQMHFDVPVELVRGEIVSPYGEDGMTRPGWPHSIVCSTVNGLLWNWCEQTRSGYTGSNDGRVLTEQDPDTLRGPDAFFVSSGRLPAGGIPDGVPAVAPDLCVEVLSPSDRWGQVRRKIAEYLDAGVGEVWVIDWMQKVVHVFRDDQSPREVRHNEVLESDIVPGFSVSVARLFKGIQ